MSDPDFQDLTSLFQNNAESQSNWNSGQNLQRTENPDLGNIAVRRDRKVVSRKFT